MVKKYWCVVYDTVASGLKVKHRNTRLQIVYDDTRDTSQIYKKNVAWSKSLAAKVYYYYVRP